MADYIFGVGSSAKTILVKDRISGLEYRFWADPLSNAEIEKITKAVSLCGSPDEAELGDRLANQAYVSIFSARRISGDAQNEQVVDVDFFMRNFSQKELQQVIILLADGAFGQAQVAQAVENPKAKKNQSGV